MADIVSDEVIASLRGICDCHVHVFDSEDRYPFDPARTYTPGSAPLQDLVAMHQRMGVERMVIVQASPYGTDNACLLDVLHSRGEGARGVAVIDDSVLDSELQRMHEAGVRGVRVNLETVGQNDPVAARAELLSTARRVKDFGWHVQTYTNLKVFQQLAEVLPLLPVPLVVDHFGRARGELGRSQAGFEDLAAALRSGQVYVKLSAPYRCSGLADYADMADLAKALFEANPERVLWGSDWPHPGAAAGQKRSPSEITPFRDEDNEKALRRCCTWAPSVAHLRQILVDNPARLYEFPVAA